LAAGAGAGAAGFTTGCAAGAGVGTGVDALGAATTGTGAVAGAGVGAGAGVLLLPMIGGPAGGGVIVITPADACAAGVAAGVEGAAGVLGRVSSCEAACVVLGSNGGYAVCANCFGLYL
jgi:hypothetical protein